MTDTGVNALFAEKRGGIFPLLVWDRPPVPHHVGLVLGGGSARAMTHIGVLEVFEEEGIPINMIAACSGGAVVGALLAAGVSPKKMHELSRGLSWQTLTTPSLRPRHLTSLRLIRNGFPLGLLSLDPLMDWLEENMGDVQEFAQLKVSFAAVATDISTGELVVMNDGKIGPAVRASCSVPGIFTPFRRNDRLLVDGGVIANLPVQVARQMGAEYVIAVNLLPFPGTPRKEPENIVDLSLTSIYDLIRANGVYSEHADCTISPDIDRFSFRDLTAAEELIAEGRAAAEAQLPKIRHALGLQK